MPSKATKDAAKEPAKVSKAKAKAAAKEDQKVKKAAEKAAPKSTAKAATKKPEAKPVEDKAAAKKRGKKDKDAPKKPMPPFFCYQKIRRKQLVDANPTWDNQRLIKKMSEEWNTEMNDEAKKQYREVAE